MNWSTSKCRTRGSIARERGHLTGKPNYSVKALPIPLIPVGWETPLIQAVPPDTMHMQNRGGDKLVKGFISASGKFTGDPLAPAFAELVNTTGVRFSIWPATVHGQNQIKYTPLTGTNWRILLKRLGPAIKQSTGVFCDADKEHFGKLVEEFGKVMEFAGKCQKSDAAEVGRRTQNWMKLFLGLGAKGYSGFAKSDVMPYLHWFHVHMPYSIFLFGGLDKINGELLENQNDQTKMTHQQQTHCKDEKMTLLAKKRCELQLMKAEIEQLNSKKERVRQEGPKHPW